jgi:phage terminase large subunit
MNLRTIKEYGHLFNLDENIRYVIIMGGRGAGRSYVASCLALVFMKTWSFFRGAVMRFVLSDVRNSNFKQVLDRIDEQEICDEFTIKDLEILYGTNSLQGLGFRKSSGDQKSKLKSLADYNFLHIEEADEVAREDFNQVDDSVRTKKGRILIVITLNPPPKNHWIVKRWLNLIPSGIDGYYDYELKDSEKHNTILIKTNWTHNAKNISQTSKDNYLRYKETDPDYYYTMICGLVPSGKRGVIFKDWKPISRKDYDELEYKPYYSGDFGFTNDPTALVEIKEHNNKVYVKELIYETGLINRRISERMAQMELNRSSEQIWDSAEPKSIAELRVENWNAIPSEKGAGSRRARIDYLLGKEVYYVEGSENIVNEVQNYCWALDKNKEPTNEPADGNDHLMDAISGGVFTKSKQPYIGF